MGNTTLSSGSSITHNAPSSLDQKARKGMDLEAVGTHGTYTFVPNHRFKQRHSGALGISARTGKDKVSLDVSCGRQGQQDQGAQGSSYWPRVGRLLSWEKCLLYSVCHAESIKRVLGGRRDLGSGWRVHHLASLLVTTKCSSCFLRQNQSGSCSVPL